MASILVGRAKHLTAIFLFKGRVLAETLLNTASKRYLSQEKPISRFPVPIMDTLPKDIQERMREVQEKVRSRKSCLETYCYSAVEGLHRKLLIFFNVLYNSCTKVQFYKLVAHSCTGPQSMGRGFQDYTLSVYGWGGGVLDGLRKL